MYPKPLVLRLLQLLFLIRLSLPVTMISAYTNPVQFVTTKRLLVYNNNRNYYNYNYYYNSIISTSRKYTPQLRYQSDRRYIIYPLLTSLQCNQYYDRTRLRNQNHATRFFGLRYDSSYSISSSIIPIQLSSSSSSSSLSLSFRLLATRTTGSITNNEPSIATRNAAAASSTSNSTFDDDDDDKNYNDYESSNNEMVLYESSYDNDDSTNDENDDDDDGDTTIIYGDENDDENDNIHDDDDDGSTQNLDDSDNDNNENNENDEESDDPVLNEYNIWYSALTKEIHGIERKRNSLQNELEKATKLQELKSRADLLATYMYEFTSTRSSTITVPDWDNDGQQITITLNPKYSSVQEETTSLYEEAKKLKRSTRVIAPLLEATQDLFSTLNDIKLDMESILDDSGISISNIDTFRLLQDKIERLSRTTSLSNLPPSGEGSSTSKKGQQQQTKQPGKSRTTTKKPTLGTPASNVRKVISPAGTTIYVGRNRRGNEYLSFTIAKGSDIWMHARGVPGAHIVIKHNPRQTESISDDCIQLGANLASFYSDARNERRVPITVTEPKHILKPRGAPLGAVKIREESSVVNGFPDAVPNEFKEARENAGVLSTTEYRASDKAKLRKKNQEAVNTKKQQQQQQKKNKKEKKK